MYFWLFLLYSKLFLGSYFLFLYFYDYSLFSCEAAKLYWNVMKAKCYLEYQYESNIKCLTNKKHENAEEEEEQEEDTYLLIFMDKNGEFKEYTYTLEELEDNEDNLGVLEYIQQKILYMNHSKETETETETETEKNQEESITENDYENNNQTITNLAFVCKVINGHLYYFRIHDSTSQEHIENIKVVNKPFIQVELEDNNKTIDIKDELEQFYVSKNKILDKTFLTWFMYSFYGLRLEEEYKVNIIDDSVNMITLTNKNTGVSNSIVL